MSPTSTTNTDSESVAGKASSSGHASPASSSPRVDPFRSDPKDYRGLPTLAFLLALVRRNILLTLVIVAVMSPFILVAVLSSGSTYQSTLALHFDPTDSVEADYRQTDSARFNAALTILVRELSSQDFFVELASRLKVPETVSSLEKLPVIGPTLAGLRGKKALDLKDPKVLLARAKGLKLRLTMTSDLITRSAMQTKLTAQGASVDEAQELVITAVDLLLDRYYAEEVRRSKSGYEAQKRFMEDERVKLLVAKAREAPPDDGDSGARRESRQEAAERRVRQQGISDKIRDLNARVTAAREQKARLATSFQEMSQRYGPYHPQMRALQSQIDQAERGTTNPEGELRDLEGQLAQLGGDPNAEDRMLDERVDRTLKRLGNRLDRSQLELIKLEQQLQNRERRTRLAPLGTPTFEADPVVAKKGKTAVMGAVAALALGLVVALVREVRRKQALDPWRISWRLNLPCLTALDRKTVKLATRPLDGAGITGLREALAARGAKDKRAQLLLTFRRLAQLIRGRGRGHVLLMVRGSDAPVYGDFLGNLFGVLASDHAARTLVIDVNAQDPLERGGIDGGRLIDFMANRSEAPKVISRGDKGRVFDLTRLGPDSEPRLAEIFSASRFRQFIVESRRAYPFIVISGFGPSRFLENALLLNHCTDCVLVVHGRTSEFAGLDELKAALGATGRIRGYVHLQG